VAGRSDVDYHLMSTWLRLALITMTVGGGFAGLCSVVQAFFKSEGGSPVTMGLFAVMLVFYLFVIASGLLFVQHPQNTRPLFAALIIQVPWFSSSWFAYKFTTGFDVLFGMLYPQGGGSLTFRWNFFLGGESQFTFGQSAPFILGINLWALAMLVLLHRSARLPVARPLNQTATPAPVETSLIGH
jgi:hypothetical protein